MEDDPEEGKDGAETPEHQAIQLQTPSKNRMIDKDLQAETISKLRVYNCFKIIYSVKKLRLSHDR